MRKMFLPMMAVLVIAALLVMPAGCGSEGSSGGGGYQGSFTDDLGRQVSLEGVPQRIVSVAPACTEILFALGLGDKVVGVTEYCDYPAEASSKAKIGTFTTPNLESILAQDPDLVLAAAGVQNDMVDRMVSVGLNVYVVDPTTFADTVAVIRDIGALTGTEEAAEEIAVDMEERAAVITGAVADDKAAGKASPKVFYEIFYESNVWTAGSDSIISDLITLAGGTNLGDADSSDYYEFSVESLINESPDVYLVGSGSMANPGDIGARDGWDRISAVSNGRVYVIDEDLAYRTGPRLIDGLESIYAAIQGD
jgi:iron complex transport system substrate-binding protein